MTSFAFILGTVLLAVATAAGAVSRQIFGTVVIGGMMAATCTAACLMPVTFCVVERLARTQHESKIAVNVTPSGSASAQGTA